MSRRLPNAPTVLVNTLWHSEDVPNQLKKLNEEKPGSVPQPFVFINIPAQAQDNDPLGRKPGEWLWCKDQQDDGFYSIIDYETKRATMPPSLWSALYLGQPLDQMGDFIKEDQFRRYPRPPMNREGHPIEWTKTVMSIDTAAKGKERSDYTAILIFRQGVNGEHYLVDAWRGKDTMEKIVRVMSKMMRIWQVNYAIVEDTGMGIQILENYQGKVPAPMLPYTPSGKGSKDFRFDAATPWIISGRILFPEHAPWLADVINEMVAFPNGSYDDWVDAFSQYTDHELKTKRGGTKPLRARV
jgi:predicted phage terminase large subunit-like protein